MRKLLTSIALAMLLAGPADAAQRAAGAAPADGQSVLAPLQANGLTLSQAVEQVRRQCKGRIVSAETRGDVHEIKCLTQDGTVRTFRIPAKRGG